MSTPAYLIVGAEEVLVRREAERLLDELRATHGELDLTDARAEELREAGLPDLRTASLFGSPRAVVIRDAHELPTELAQALAVDLEGTPPDATVLLLARSTQRIQKLAKVVKDLGGRIDCKLPADWDEKGWARLVTAELERHGRTADRDAANALLDAAGRDLGAIAEKVSQVVARAPTGTITLAQVEETVVGRGSRGSFAVADAMCDRDPARALTELRGVLESGVEPLAVLGALAYRLRALVAVAGNVHGEDTGLRLSDGMIKRHQAVRRNFGPGELTRAYRRLADVDYEAKTGAGEPVELLERAVVDIATPASGSAR
ncbi:DNA polymerase III subunit delta [Egibacter rhizosphaerae]|uniref:DNA-directed DNA polymerase n=1 Tax=Egibacter rhizosphaerae TaxID=1670831 RepID=A0A411YBQ5_9ACTN|nr:DNA polymerase III subunit delta [Egibacter rhizosphaerae]QBI18644.1 DNA polymerase III subunit delta [Egibacter rhizosphaerae]